MRIWPRAGVAPFELAIAVIIVVQAVIAFGGWGAFNVADVLLPGWLSATFNGAYLLSGLAIIAGLCWPRGDIEGAGLVLLAATVVARGIMFGALLGWGFQSVTSLAFSFCVAGACAARIAVIARTSGRRSRSER